MLPCPLSLCATTNMETQTVALALLHTSYAIPQAPQCGRLPRHLDVLILTLYISSFINRNAGRLEADLGSGRANLSASTTIHGRLSVDSCPSLHQLSTT